MVANEIRIAGTIEVPHVEVDDEFTLEVRVRVFSIERDQIDVAGYGDETAKLPGGLRMLAVAVRDWESEPTEPAPLPADYWETAT